jgi:hypothetical protein
MHDLKEILPDHTRGTLHKPLGSPSAEALRLLQPDRETKLNESVAAVDSENEQAATIASFQGEAVSIRAAHGAQHPGPAS